MFSPASFLVRVALLTVLAGAIASVNYAMLLGSIFLLVVGAGRWSFHAVLARKAQAP